MGKVCHPVRSSCLTLFSYRTPIPDGNVDLVCPVSRHIHRTWRWWLYSLSHGLQSPHKARASRHWVGTYVVDSAVSGPLKTDPIWGAHWWIISSFLFLIVFTAMSKGISIEWRQKSGHVSQQSEDARLIEKLGDVQTAKVLIWGPTQLDGSALGNFLPKKKAGRITVEWKGKMAAREAFADQVASIILQNDPRAQKQDLIRIQVGRSYSLVIASGNDYQSFTHTPEEWRQRAFGPLPDASPVRKPQE
jgi:hypothetical protein